MGCCESSEESSYMSQDDKSAKGAPETAKAEAATKAPEKALRKVVASEEPKEIICGGLRLRYAFLSQKGYYPDDPHKPNQDAYSIAESSRDVSDSTSGPRTLTPGSVRGSLTSRLRV